MTPRDDPADVELERTTPEWAVQPQPVPVAPWVAFGVFAVTTAIALYVVLGVRPSKSATVPDAVSAPTARAPAPVAPARLGTAAEPVSVPALDDSDPVVRSLVRALSRSRAIEVWLTTSDLIRGFVAVVANIADGRTPAVHLRILRPKSAFRVVERGGHEEIDPRSYDRYTWIADAVASVDAAHAARLYGTLRARIDEASRELGRSDPTFDRTIERALDSLLLTPVVDQPIRVVPKGIGYAYQDARLENLTAAQKQLLRMGAGNVRRIQAQLRAIAVALGIQPALLPPPEARLG